MELHPTHNAPDAVQAARHRRLLAPLIDDTGVVLSEINSVSHFAALPCVVVGIVQAGEFSPAFHRFNGVCAGFSVVKPGLTTKVSLQGYQRTATARPS